MLWKLMLSCADCWRREEIIPRGSLLITKTRKPAIKQELQGFGDFMFRFCKFAIPSKRKDASLMFRGHDSISKSMQDKSMEEQLQEYENIVRFDEIEKQLMVTRAKQEKDVIYPFKFHDDVEARQGAVERLMQVEENHELRLNRLETLVQQIQGGTSDFNPYLSPAANTGSGLRHASSKSKGRK
uniref:Uncharacterized protein n=1 Tax=Ditylenchus dipsaci TaxID=166011 RepID=A0A915CTL3_9BILA